MDLKLINEDLVNKTLDSADPITRRVLESDEFSDSLYEVIERYNYDIDDEEVAFIFQLTSLIVLKILKPEELPKEIKFITGDDNKEIESMAAEINKLIEDFRMRDNKLASETPKPMQKPTPSPFIIEHKEEPKTAPQRPTESFSPGRPSFLHPTFSERYKEDMIKRMAAKIEVGDGEDNQNKKPQSAKTKIEEPKVVNYSKPEDKNPFGNEPKKSPKAN